MNASASQPSAPLNILYVEDDPLDLELVAGALERGGLSARITRVETAEALERELAAHHFDLFLADYALPSFDGLEALKLLQEWAPDVPVIVISGKVGEEVAIETLKNGATDYVLKQRLFRLVPSVQRALREREERRAQKEAERKLQHTAEDLERQYDLLESVLGQMPAGVVVTEAESRDVLLANARAEAILGADVRGLGTSQFGERLVAYHPDGRRYASEEFPISRALDRQELVRDEVIDFWGPAGRMVTALANAAPVRDRAGKVIAAVTTLLDITERRRAEEFQERVVAIVGHDIRNPLAAIIAGASFLLRAPEATQRQAKTIARVLTSAQRIEHIVVDLLNYTRVNLGSGIPIHPEATDLHQICRRVTEELEASNPGRTFAFDATGDGKGKWDAERLQQVFSNLLGNAVKYSPEDTPITLKAEPEGERVVVRIHNEGEPIPPSLLPHIFEPFRHGHQEGSTVRTSLGLGLYIARYIVQEHGGTLDVSSTAEAGTTFTVRLPRITPPRRA